MNKIEESAHRLSDLSSNLLDFIRGAGLEEKSDSIDLKNTIVKVLHMFDGLVKKNGIKITVELEDNLPLLWGVESLAESLIANLLINAKDALEMAMKEYRMISIVLKEERESVVLLFSDSGHGMSRSHVAKIFDPFFTTKGAGKGTGLGMKIIGDAVSHLNGKIRVFSEVGMGTTFRFVFERKQEIISKSAG